MLVTESDQIHPRIAEPVYKLNNNIEAIRGFAAVFVAIGHAIILSNILDPFYLFNGIHYDLIPGKICVLIFFVLSGYVISLNYKERLTGTKIFEYLKKRFIRLYPIYVICLIFSLLVANQVYPTQTIISHFTFTQIIFSDVIKENHPLWSLQYEVLYYLLFIPLSRFNPIGIACISVAFGLGNYFITPQVPIITAYSFGFTFWVSGWIIARYLRKSQTKTNYSLLFSNVFLMLCIGMLNVLTNALNILSEALEIPTKYPKSVSMFEKAIDFNDLAFLPYGCMFILVAIGKDFKGSKLIFTVLQLLPAITFIYIFRNIHAKQTAIYLWPSIFYLFSLLFFFVRFDKLAAPFIKFGIWLGGLSYAIYVIHFPLLYLFNQIEVFSGTGLTYSIRMMLFIIITILFSYILEKKVQPWIRGVILPMIK